MNQKNLSDLHPAAPGWPLARLCVYGAVVCLALLFSSPCSAQAPIVADTTAPDEVPQPVEVGADDAAAAAAAAKAARRRGGPEGKPTEGDPTKLGPDGKPLPGAGKPDGKEAGKDSKEGSAPTPVTRSAEPPTPPDAKELQVRPDKDGTVQFSFRNQPWPEILRWLAEVSNLSLDWQELPGDYLNLATQRPYTLVETRDVVNRHLLSRGFTLLEAKAR